MRVRHVPIRPTPAAIAAGRPSLTPELLAATGARYSRNDEGLDAILAKIDLGNGEQVLAKLQAAIEKSIADAKEREEKFGGKVSYDDSRQLAEAVLNYRPGNLDAGVDSIFKMIDYGHQSIADMAPVAMFMDGISIYMAYYLWSLCPLAGGQESSTRYINMDGDGALSALELGIPDSVATEFEETRRTCYEAYKYMLTHWEQQSEEFPELVNIPSDVLNDPSEKAQKAVARMKRNYAFDRARYFLPLSAKTNVMIVQPARQWVYLCQYLLSSELKEAQSLGHNLVNELELVVPRLIRHATERREIRQHLSDEFLQNVALRTLNPTSYTKPTPFLETMEVNQFPFIGNLGQGPIRALLNHSNRYMPIGNWFTRMAVRFGWTAVAIAEIRDLNRHRTGTKYCPLVPVGTYTAEDQDYMPGKNLHERYDRMESAYKATQLAYKRLGMQDPTYIYHAVLGTQFPFEHTTTADKFLYEAELRTGVGSHYRYCDHLKRVLELWYEKYPETKGRVLEGSGEPE